MRPRDGIPTKFARAVARVTAPPRHSKISQVRQYGIAAPENCCELVADDEQFIRAKLQRYVATGQLRCQDVDDLVQLVLLHLSHRLRGFHAARGRRQAFVNRVIENFAAKVLSARRSMRRRVPIVLSINEPLTNGGERRVEFGDVLSACHRRPSALNPHCVDLALDLSTALAKLPPTLREIAEKRWLGFSASEIAQIQCVHRSTIIRRTKTLAELLRPRLAPGL